MGEAPLTVKDYQERAKATDRIRDNGVFSVLGLFGEVGSLLSEAKKKQRGDVKADKDYYDHVLEEVGDILWYLNAVALRAELSISDIACRIIEDRDDLKGSPHKPSFDELQGIEKSTYQNQEQNQEHISKEILLDLARKVSSLINVYELEITKNNYHIIANSIHDILFVMIQLANETKISLDSIARGNLKKIDSRWPKEKRYPAPFDMEFPKHERFPRKMSIDIFEETNEGREFVMQRYMDINIGDRLTDNASIDDDYRFHDVFHYAYVSILGWSPVTRALLRLKRKSCSRTDEIQDGARAILIEEGITTWIFNQARKQDLFENIKYGGLSFDLLKSIDQFVKGYEVEKCPLWLWEEAILQGYDVFRFLKKHRRGKVHIDMSEHKFSITELPK